MYSKKVQWKFENNVSTTVFQGKIYFYFLARVYHWFFKRKSSFWSNCFSKLKWDWLYTVFPKPAKRMPILRLCLLAKVTLLGKANNSLSVCVYVCLSVCVVILSWWCLKVKKLVFSKSAIFHKLHSSVPFTFLHFVDFTF